MRPLFTIENMSSFGSLKELDIQRTYEDLVRVEEVIVNVLLRSPNLQTLSLSTDGSAIFRLHDAKLSSDFMWCLEDIIERYEAADGKPLRLRKLVLGLGVVLCILQFT